MTKSEQFVPQERGKKIFETSQQAVRMIIERINLESMGLRLKHLPLCTEADAEMIEGFIPRAREGFSLTLKAERVLPGEILGLLDQTTPLTAPSRDNRVVLLENENTIPEFLHTLSTFAYLLEMRHVTFFNFSEPPAQVDYELGLQESIWMFNTFSVDHLWSKMLDIEKTTRAALYQEEPMEPSELLKIGHFYTAGKELSKIFS